jgi:hypothetical protein
LGILQAFHIGNDFVYSGGSMMVTLLVKASYCTSNHGQGLGEVEIGNHFFGYPAT